MYFTPSAVKRQNFLRREKRLPPPPCPPPPPPRRSSPPRPPPSPPRPPPPSLLKAIALYLSALRRPLRSSCPHRRRQRKLLHAGGVGARPHHRRLRHHGSAHGDDRHPPRPRLSPSEKVRLR